MKLKAILPFAVLVVAASAAFAGGNPAGITTGLVPLDALGTGMYQAATGQGATGGLYPAGGNVIPAVHFTAGQALAQQVQPLDSAGLPSGTGKIGVVCLGMSNSSFIFGAMNELLLGQTAPNVVIVQAAQGGYDVGEWADPANVIWSNTIAAVNAKGITPAQVQVVLQYHSMANSKYPPQTWPTTPKDFETFCEQTMRNLPAVFPNAKLCLWSSREYAGFTTTMNNPEPYAYESGFAVKWMIEKQINGDASLNFDSNAGPVMCPWMAWGPYVWGDGITPRADGLLWEMRDFNADGVHPSVRGRTKAGAAWARFLLTNPLTSPWLRAPGNRPPMVKVIGPTTNVIVEGAGRVAIEAHAEDVDGSVARVDFYQGNTLLGSDATAPYSFLWTGGAPGDYTVKAVGIDDMGAATTSLSITLLLRDATTAAGTMNLATDGFESSDFVGGAGWLSQGWTFVGNATVTAALAPPAGTYQAQLRAGASLTRAVDLSAVAAPDLSFKWRGQLPAGYTFLVESIGTATQTLFSRTSVSPTATLTEAIPLAPFQPGANFTLRFRVTGPANTANLLLDDIRITTAAPTAAATPGVLLRATAPGEFQLIGTAAIHRTYTLEFSTDLATWTPLHHTTAIEDGTNLFPVSVNEAAGFFRAMAVFP